MACKESLTSVLVLQHDSCEPLGTIEDALQARGITMRIIGSYAGEPVPRQVGEAAGLIVMGGSMGVPEQERYPFLREEISLIGDALSRNVPVLGVCLGAQLLAHTLGATVAKARQPEIGWFPLSLTEAGCQDPLWAGIASPCVAFHWHEDAFDLPPHAVALASSALTPCQAFRFGANAYGLQCHLEVTEAILESWIVSSGENLRNAGIDTQEIRAGYNRELPRLQRTAHAVFGAWTALIAP